MYAEKTKKESVQMAFELNFQTLRQFMLYLVTTAIAIVALLFLEYGYWSTDFNYIFIGLVCIEALLCTSYFFGKTRMKKMINLIDENPDIPIHFEVSKQNLGTLKVGDMTVGVQGGGGFFKLNKKKKNQIDEVYFHLAHYSHKYSEKQQTPFQ